MGSRRGGWGEVGGTATAMGVDGCLIGVKRLPEVGDDGGDRDGDVVFAKRSLQFFPSSSSLSLKSACMKCLVCLVIYKKFLYPLGVQKIWVLLWLSVPTALSVFFFPPNLQMLKIGCKFGTSNFGVPF